MLVHISIWGGIIEYLILTSLGLVILSFKTKGRHLEHINLVFQNNMISFLSMLVLNCISASLPTGNFHEILELHWLLAIPSKYLHFKASCYLYFACSSVYETLNLGTRCGSNWSTINYITVAMATDSEICTWFKIIYSERNLILMVRKLRKR